MTRNARKVGHLIGPVGREDGALFWASRHGRPQGDGPVAGVSRLSQRRRLALDPPLGQTKMGVERRLQELWLAP